MKNATINSETSFSVSGCITLGNSPLTVDITSASAGATIGTYADTNTLQAGTTYRYFVPPSSRTFSMGSFDYSTSYTDNMLVLIEN